MAKNKKECSEIIVLENMVNTIFQLAYIQNLSPINAHTIELWMFMHTQLFNQLWIAQIK